MKTIGQIIDEIDKRIADFEGKILNPDRSQYLTNYETHRRAELADLRKFIIDGTNEVAGG